MDIKRNGTPDQLLPVTVEVTDTSPPNKGIHKGQEVTHADVPGNQSAATEKAVVLEKMPALEQRQVDLHEQAMTQFKMAVEKPVFVITPPEEAPVEELPQAANDTVQENVPATEGNEVPEELTTQVAGTLKEALALKKTIKEDVKRAKANKKSRKAEYSKAQKEVDNAKEEIEKLQQSIQSHSRKIESSRFKKSSHKKEVDKKTVKLQNLRDQLPELEKKAERLNQVYQQADAEYEKLQAEETRLKEQGATVHQASEEGGLGTKLTKKLAKRLMAASGALEDASGEDIQKFVFQSKDSMFSSIISMAAKKWVASTGYLLDAKEVEEAKKLKKSSKKRYEKARDAVADSQSQIRSLKEKIQKLSAKLEKPGLFKTFRSKKLQKKSAELEQKQQALPELESHASHQLKAFEDAVKAYDNVATNGKKLVESASQFLGSVRGFYAACHPKHGEPRDVRLNIPLQHLDINTPDGVVTLDNVNISIANIEFVKGPKGKMCPIFTVGELDATATIQMPDGQLLKTTVAAKGVKFGLSGSAGQLLHNYITASNSVTAGYGLLKEISHVTDDPNFISLSAQSIDVDLPEMSPTIVASFIKKTKSTPEPAINGLFRELNFRLSAKLSTVKVTTQGELKANGSFNDVSVDYRPDIPKAEGVQAVKPDCTPRRMTVSCASADGSVDNALSVVGELKEVLTPESPLDKWLDIALPLQTAPPYTENTEELPPPPYTLEAPPGTIVIGPEGDVVSEGAPIAPQFKVGDLVSFTGKTGFKAKNITVNMTRDIEGAGTEKAKITGYDRIKADVNSLTVTNEGNLGATVTVNGIDANVNLTDGEEVELTPGTTVTPPTLDAHVQLASASAKLSVPKGKMMDDLLGEDTYISGEVKLTAAEPVTVDCKQTGKTLTIDSDIPKLEADVSQPFLASKKGMGVFLPKGHIELGGKVSVSTNEQVTTIAPELTLSSEDNLEILVDGQRIPLDLSAKVSLEKTTPKLFVREDPDTGVKALTPVISRGTFHFDRLKAGPANIGQVKVVLDGEKFGAIHINEVEVSLDAVTDMLYKPPMQDVDPEMSLSSGGFDLPGVMKNPLIKWAIKRIARNKKLICDAQLKVVDGTVDLKQLGDIQLKFVSESTGRFDRLITWSLGKLTQRYTKKLLKFSLSVEDCKIKTKSKTTEQTTQGLSAGTAEDSKEEFTIRRMPVLRIPAPVNGAFPIPLPSACVNSDDKSISLSSLLQETTGALMVSRRDVASVEEALGKIENGAHEGINTLLQMIETNHSEPSRQGLLHLVATQFPLKSVGEWLESNQTTRELYSERLAACSTLLLRHPDLCHEAIQLSQLSDKAIDEQRIKQLVQESATNPKINPVGLGMLLEEKHDNPELAAKCYQVVLDRNPSDPLANRCMGLLLLKQDPDSFNLSDVTKGYEYLIKAWEAGDRTVRKHLEALEKSDQIPEPDESGADQVVANPAPDAQIIPEEPETVEATIEATIDVPQAKELEALEEAQDKPLPQELKAPEKAKPRALTAEQKSSIARDAKLRLAMIRLAEEKDHEDFTEAMSRLVELAHDENDAIVQQQAVRLIAQRRDNGTLHFHTSDIKLFNDGQEQLKEARKHLKKLKVKELKPVAKELGMKCLYGSHGVVQNIDMAFQLLLIAASGEDQEARFHLGMAQAALNPKQTKSYDKLARAAAAAAAA